MQAKCSTGYFPSTRFAFEAYNNDLSKNPFNVNAYQIVTAEILTHPPVAGLRRGPQAECMRATAEGGS